MKKRVITGVILFLVLIIALVLRQVNAYIFDALIILLSIAATAEIAICLFHTEEQFSRTAVLICAIINACLTGGLFLTALLTNTLTFLFAYLLLALCLMATILIIINAVKYKSFIKIKYLFPLIYPNYLFLFFFLINHLSAFNLFLNNSIGLYILVNVFIISMLTDTFAMLTGMMIKGPKLCPKLSPKKTISGAIGGLIFGTGGGLAVYSIFNVIDPFTKIFADANVAFGYVLLFSFLTSLVCQIGDLFESYFKRKVGIKDSGTILAGHGGIMDRLDGVSFAVVMMFICSIVMFI